MEGLHIGSGQGSLAAAVQGRWERQRQEIGKDMLFQAEIVEPSNCVKNVSWKGLCVCPLSEDSREVGWGLVVWSLPRPKVGRACNMQQVVIFHLQNIFLLWVAIHSTLSHEERRELGQLGRNNVSNIKELRSKHYSLLPSWFTGPMGH